MRECKLTKGNANNLTLIIEICFLDISIIALMEWAGNLTKYITFLNNGNYLIGFLIVA